MDSRSQGSESAFGVSWVNVDFDACMLHLRFFWGESLPKYPSSSIPPQESLLKDYFSMRRSGSVDSKVGNVLRDELEVKLSTWCNLSILLATSTIAYVSCESLCWTRSLFQVWYIEIACSFISMKKISEKLCHGRRC